jgi:hypothetical protein
MVVKSSPVPPFKVVESELAFQLLEISFDAPTKLYRLYELLHGR